MKLHASFRLYFKYYRQVLLIKSSFLPCCFRWAFTSADIIFCNFFLTSFNIAWKKDFCHKFSFFNGFTQTHNPLNGQNLLSVTKRFCPYYLTFCKESLPNFACAQKSSERKLKCSVSLNIISIIITVQKFWWSDWSNGVQLSC